MSGGPAFLPVILLTGFLGSGKTTLLARLLRDPALSDSAVLINEFGEVGLDHHLLDRVDETVVLLQSGCLCCTIRGELAAAIKDLLSRRDRGVVPPFGRLIIETTGLADPTPALSTLAADPVLRYHVRVGAVVTTVDARNGRDTLARHPESLKQVAVADRLILTKTDLCDAGPVRDLVAALRAVSPDADLIDLHKDAFDAEAILGERVTRAGGFVCDDAGTAAPGGRHGGETGSFVVTVDGALDWTLFGLWLSLLLHRHGDRILRVKGLLNVEGSATPVALHGVQQLVHPPAHLSGWPDGDRRSKIVFITRGLDARAIRTSMRAFGLLTTPACEPVPG